LPPVTQSGRAVVLLNELAKESFLGAMALMRGATKGVLARPQHADSAPTAVY
jgi:hypothetical protein